LTAAEKELFIENIALKTENGFLKNQNQALRERIHALEQIPEFEAIKNAAHGAGTPKSSKEKHCIKIVAQIF
jgi:hypothetical protein